MFKSSQDKSTDVTFSTLAGLVCGYGAVGIASLAANMFDKSLSGPVKLTIGATASAVSTYEVYTRANNNDAITWTETSASEKLKKSRNETWLESLCNLGVGYLWLNGI